MTPRELSQKLNDRIEAVCNHLLKNGKRHGSEWCTGSLSGGKGDSCRVHLSGERVGVWADFASGERGGDLLDLWMAVHRVDLTTAMREARSWLGMPEPEFEPKERQSSSKRPERPKDIKRPVAVAEYLNRRGLTDETIARFQIGEIMGKDGKPVIVFPFKRDGDLISIKYLAVERDADGKKKTWGEKDCDPCLFGWQALDPNTRLVCLCEGEIDAMTLHQVGVQALSVPNGAGAHQWIEHEYDRLERFDQIFVLFDSDPPGKKGALEVLDRLGRHRCRLAEIPFKDPNEALQRGATEADFISWFARARTLDPDELKNATHFTAQVIEEFYPTKRTIGVALPWEKVADKVRFRPAEVSVWTGLNGSGKSQLLGFIAIHAMSAGQRFCIASMEMLPSKTIYRMIRQITGQHQPSKPYIETVQTWLGDYLWMFDVTGTAKVERLFVNFEYASRRYGIGQFVVDSLAKCGMAEDDYSGQKDFVERLTDFARQHNVHVHLVVHPRKQDDENGVPGKMDVKGTGAITDMADNVFSVWRNKRKEEALQELQNATDTELSPETVEELQGKPDVRVVCSKQRNGEWEGGIALWYDRESLQYLGSPSETRRRYVDFG